MRTKDAAFKRTILDYVENYIMTEGRSPTLSTIAEGIHAPKSNVQRYLIEMNEDNMVKYTGNSISTIRTEKCNPAVLIAPMLGNIRCGDPSMEEANVEEYIRLPKSVFGSEEAYLLRAWGDSMEDAGIDEGDVLVVHRTAQPRKGDVIVALDDNNCNTLKEYGGMDEKTGKAKLLYRNEAVYGDKVILVDQLACQGVLAYVIKKLH